MKKTFLALAALMMAAPAMAQTEPPVVGNDGIGGGPAAMYCNDASTSDMMPIEITDSYVKTSFQGIVQIEKIARVEFRMEENDLGLVGVTNLLNAKGKLIATISQQGGKDTVVLGASKARTFVCNTLSI